MTVPPREVRTGLAVLFVALAFLCFTAVDASAKWLVGAGLPVIQVVFLRYAGHFALSLAVFLPQEGTAVFRSHALKLQLLRTAMLLICTVCNFMALRYLPLTVTTAIVFASPVLVCLLSIPLLGERVGIRRLVAVIVGFAGVLVIVQPGGAGFHPAMFFSLVTLVGAALYFILTRMVAGRDGNATGQILTSGLATAIIAPFALPFWTALDANTALIALLTGAFAAIGHSLLTIGHRYAEASVLAPLVYVQVLYATAASWIIFAEPPTASTAAGTAIIVASGLYIWLRERRPVKIPL